MPVYLLAHQPRQDSVVAWVGWWQADAPPALRIRLDDGQEFDVVGDWGEPLGWAGRLGNRRWTRLTCQAMTLTGLSPDTHYTASLQRIATDEELARCEFDTLPTALAPDLVSSADPRPRRTFTIGLGSCYWARDDVRRTVADRWRRLYETDLLRPHVTFLVGDQVYVDYHPVEEFSVPKVGTDLPEYVTGRYALHWNRLHGLLSRGANICLPDDHEYWNDYPYAPQPGAAWPALQISAYRDRVEEHCRAFADAVQLVRPTTRLDIGTELSVFAADLRTDRDTDGQRFASDDAMTELTDWATQLQCPGVLVIPQPLFARAVATLDDQSFVVDLLADLDDPLEWALGVFGADTGETVTDHNLRAFDQYRSLTRALTGAPHDIVVLAGDVHFGRVSSVSVLRTDDGDPLHLWEVIASPMRQLPGAGSGPDTASYHLNRAWWDPAAVHESAMPLPYLSRVHATAHVELGDPGRTVEHLTTLQFHRHPSVPGAVQVSVQSWATVLAPRRSGLPVRVLDHTFDLDAHRPPAGQPAARRTVTHVGRGRQGQIRALVNPGQPWSPRLAAGAIHDIRDRGVPYATRAATGASAPIEVVDGARGPYLRTRADDDVAENLENLPEAAPEDLRI